MTKKRSNILDLCIVGLATALTCVVAPISIPLPIGVPITLQTFIITLIAIVLGPKRAVISTSLYVLLGTLGLPIFSNFTGGWQMLVGPTGGFILSFPLMAYIIGFASNMRDSKSLFTIIGTTIATLINFICGIAMFCVMTKSNLQVGITSCALPFIIPAVIKAILAYVVGIELKKRLKKSHT